MARKQVAFIGLIYISMKVLSHQVSQGTACSPGRYIHYEYWTAIRKMSPQWTHLVRFLAKEDGRIHLGQVDSSKWPDIGLALEAGSTITANLVQGCAFDGVVTDKSLTILHVRPGTDRDETRLTGC